MYKPEKLIAFYEKNKTQLEKLNENEKFETEALIEFYSDDYKGNKNCVFKNTPWKKENNML